MIATMGEGPFKGVYSVVSLITLGLVIYAFGEARQETGMLWYPPVWMSHIAITLMLLAMICLVASLIPAGHIATKTKHPLILVVKSWALAHLLANGESGRWLPHSKTLPRIGGPYGRKEHSADYRGRR